MRAGRNVFLFVIHPLTFLSSVGRQREKKKKKKLRCWLNPAASQRNILAHTHTLAQNTIATLWRNPQLCAVGIAPLPLIHKKAEKGGREKKWDFCHKSSCQNRIRAPCLVPGRKIHSKPQEMAPTCKWIDIAAFLLDDKSFEKHCPVLKIYVYIF